MDWSSWLSKTGLEPHLVHKYSLSFARNELQYEDIASLNHECLQSMGIAVAKHRLEILKLAKKETNNGANPGSISRLFVAISKTKKSFSKYFSRLVVQDDMSSKDSPEQVRYHHHHHQYQYQYQEHLRGAFLRKQSSGEMVRDDRPALKKALALSGPIDLRVNDRLMGHYPTKSLKLSGPLDGKLHDRLMHPNKSPRLTTGSLDGKILGTERLMITTTRSPRLSGPLDGMGQDRSLVTSRSPKISGPLDGRALSPKFCSPYDKEKEEVEYDEHSLWPALFQDMKPT